MRPFPLLLPLVPLVPKETDERRRSGGVPARQVERVRCAFFTGSGGGWLRSRGPRRANDGRRRSDGDRPGGSLPGRTCRTAAGGQRRRCRGPGQHGLLLQVAVRLRPSRVRRSVTTCLTGRPLSPSINLAIGASGTADTPVIGPKPDLGGAHSSPLGAVPDDGRWCGDRRSRRRAACVHRHECCPTQRRGTLRRSRCEPSQGAEPGRPS
ncbi:hypothetical protein IscW_ISCW018368 [Ixodes scapularis]|uniref:Uncharacterized protein n=1 Tax=Ixodes scapularis TaxID=6945 RepID=B7PK42_IXOSC|nr:hypothetical protein IscW_ISCW018368 [Ixodes scapularis]|eukprot:XP_002409280.1 hypothetical protein IscW_ISCW018368 [Ixodes scapularis]